MARRWTNGEEGYYRDQLLDLYVRQNLSIAQVGSLLGIGESTVFDRIQRLNIPSLRHQKTGYNNRTRDLVIPNEYSSELAEFFGIMLGDGHLSQYQIIVTLGARENEYAHYVANIMSTLFNIQGTIFTRKNGHHDIYLNSVELVEWLTALGLARNKTEAQVDIPAWIWKQPLWMSHCIRGFFDTDGSIYKIRFGRQMSFCNRSMPLLSSLRKLLIELQYNPSVVSSQQIYLTRRYDIDRFFKEISPANLKHVRRYTELSVT